MAVLKLFGIKVCRMKLLGIKVGRRKLLWIRFGRRKLFGIKVGWRKLFGLIGYLCYVIKIFAVVTVSSFLTSL